MTHVSATFHSAWHFPPFSQYLTRFQHLLIFQPFSTFFRIFSRVFNSPHAYSMNNTHSCSNTPISHLNYAKLTVFGTTHVSRPPVHVLQPFSTVNACCRPLSVTTKCSEPCDTLFGHFSLIFHYSQFPTCFLHPLLIFHPFSTLFRVFSCVFNPSNPYSMNNAHPCSNPPISGANYTKLAVFDTKRYFCFPVHIL